MGHTATTADGVLGAQSRRVKAFTTSDFKHVVAEATYPADHYVALIGWRD